PQECFDMTREAFDISERTGAVVILRLTTRTSHSSSLVDVNCSVPQERRHTPPLEYTKNIKRNVAVPANARVMRQAIESRLAALREESEKSPFNRVEPGGNRRFGFVTNAVAYQYVKEIFPEFPILKLGFTNPLPLNMIRAFASGVGDLIVVEELDPVMRDAIISAGIKTRDYKTELRVFELNPSRLAELRKELIGNVGPVSDLSNSKEKSETCPTTLPTRPPVLCAGCSHRSVFYTLAKLKATVSGDIGCYTLGCLPPLGAMETTICMGASIGVAFGMRKAGITGRVAAVIGDSTFFHSGMTGLMDAVYNKGAFTVVILDNRITGMTGHQQNPGSGKTLLGAETYQADIAQIARALGVPRVAEVDAYDLAALENVLKTELDNTDGMSVVVVKGDCVLAAGKHIGAISYKVDSDKCKACGACFKLGCPAIIRGAAAGASFQAKINPTSCVGCDICRQTCKFHAITIG
ncbi:MAG: thiamine pyrophosphate-dependent enzyme, partial [Kiritimatiellaeota bacterium]|nr:thiamine pyrophosphate-dependent enzyme [Kiritimatiellota bacterium]